MLRWVREGKWFRRLVVDPFSRSFDERAMNSERGAGRKMSGERRWRKTSVSAFPQIVKELGPHVVSCRAALVAATGTSPHLRNL
jgi:hypothetical protein